VFWGLGSGGGEGGRGKGGGSDPVSKFLLNLGARLGFRLYDVELRFRV
jgi:hypothetical protein